MAAEGGGETGPTGGEETDPVGGGETGPAADVVAVAPAVAAAEPAPIVQTEVDTRVVLSLIHISEPTRRTPISYAVFCLKKKKP